MTPVPSPASIPAMRQVTVHCGRGRTLPSHTPSRICEQAAWLAFCLVACSTNTPSEPEPRSPAGQEHQAANAPPAAGLRRPGDDVARAHSSGGGLPRESPGASVTPAEDTAAAADVAAIDAAASSGPGEPSAGVAHVFVGSTDGRVRAYLPSLEDGALTAAGQLDSGPGLDFLNASIDGRTVFVSRAASVSAYRYDPQGDRFTALDTAITSGGGTHVAVAPDGRLVIVAHYNEGAITALPFVDGQFGPAQVLEPGSNAHQVHFGTAGRRVFIPCLGSDHIAQFSVETDNLSLLPASPPTAPAPGGPRHMAWHPSLPIAYALAEKSSEVHAFDRGPDGLLQRRPSGSVHTEADEQYHWSSDIQTTAGGRHLFAVNRQPSQLVRFDLGRDGALTRAESYPLQGTVRSFAIDSVNQWLFIGGTTGTLVSYRLQGASGALTPSASLDGLGDIHSTQVRYIQ